VATFPGRGWSAQGRALAPWAVPRSARPDQPFGTASNLVGASPVSPPRKKDPNRRSRPPSARWAPRGPGWPSRRCRARYTCPSSSPSGQSRGSSTWGGQ